MRDVAVFHERMPEFLEALSLGREADIVRRSRVYTPDAVTLSTLHGAKGLEFPVVFLCGVQAGKIPLTGRAWDRPGGGTAAVLCGPHPGKGGAAAVRLRGVFPFPDGYPAELSGEGG